LEAVLRWFSTVVDYPVTRCSRETHNPKDP
jgi:hypothetical protein